MYYFGNPDENNALLYGIVNRNAAAVCNTGMID